MPSPAGASADGRAKARRPLEGKKRPAPCAAAAAGGDVYPPFTDVWLDNGEVDVDRAWLKCVEEFGNNAVASHVYADLIMFGGESGTLALLREFTKSARVNNLLDESTSLGESPPTEMELLLANHVLSRLPPSGTAACLDRSGLVNYFKVMRVFFMIFMLSPNFAPPHVKTFLRHLLFYKSAFARRPKALIRFLFRVCTVICNAGVHSEETKKFIGDAYAAQTKHLPANGSWHSKLGPLYVRGAF